jgi:hypothetical protein
LYSFWGSGQSDFYLTKDALVVFYQKYVLAAGVVGPIKFEIPYVSISNVLDILNDDVRANVTITKANKALKPDNVINNKTKKASATDNQINKYETGSNETKYKISEKTYQKRNSKLECKIKYPQIFGLSDHDKQKKINNTLKEEALKALRYYREWEGSLDLDIEYKVVLKKTNVLSIQYSGMGLVSTAAHPNNLFYTTNINIRTGKRVRLIDIVKIDKDFANEFFTGEFKALWPQQDDSLQYLSNEEIQQDFEEADSLDNIGTDKQSDVFSYLTNDSLGISISVAHAIGDHAEFEIKYRDLKDNMKTKNDIWNDLLK